jgi:hypothetical protein
MKKPSKTAAELEASIKVEMEDICDWPTDMAISVQADGDSWRVTVMAAFSIVHQHTSKKGRLNLTAKCLNEKFRNVCDGVVVHGSAGLVLASKQPGVLTAKFADSHPRFPVSLGRPATNPFQAFGCGLVKDGASQSS